MDSKASLVHDHYKDTCSIISDAVKRRDRLMLFVILVLAFFALHTIFPTVSDTAVHDFLNFKFGLDLKLDLSIIGNVVWFLLLIFTVRYFQVAAFIERQYCYIHQVEDELNRILGEKLITREGASYLHKYPAFSNWMWFLYTIVFPALLLFISTGKIMSELIHAYKTTWSIGLLLNCTAFILLAVSIVLYLFMIHRRSTGDKSDEWYWTIHKPL